MTEVWVPMTGEDWRIAQRLKLGTRYALHAHLVDGALMTVMSKRPHDEHTHWMAATFGMTLEESSEVRRG